MESLSFYDLWIVLFIFMVFIILRTWVQLPGVRDTLKFGFTLLFGQVCCSLFAWMPNFRSEQLNAPLNGTPGIFDWMIMWLPL